MSFGFSFVCYGKVLNWHVCECTLVMKSRVWGPVMYPTDAVMVLILVKNLKNTPENIKIVIKKVLYILT